MRRGRGEDDDQAVVEGRGDQVAGRTPCRSAPARLCAGSFASVPDGLSSVSIGLTPRKAANTVDTGGRVADVVGDRRPARPAPAARRRACRAARSASPVISSEKKTPIDSDGAGVLEGGPHAGRGARGCRAGTLLMIAEVFGAENMPEPDAVEQDQQRERPVREVDRQQQQPDEAGAEQQQPAGGEQRAPEPVGQVPARPARRAGSRPSAAAGRCRPTAACRRSRSRAAAARCPAAR